MTWVGYRPSFDPTVLITTLELLGFTVFSTQLCHLFHFANNSSPVERCVVKCVELHASRVEDFRAKGSHYGDNISPPTSSPHFPPLPLPWGGAKKERKKEMGWRGGRDDSVEGSDGFCNSSCSGEWN